MASLQKRSLWRNRDFLLLWSGQAVSSLGSQVSLLAFPWLILSVTHSPLLAGLIAAIRFLPYLLGIVPIHTATIYGYRLTHIPDRLQGRVTSIYRISLFGSQMLGLLVTGLLLQLVGPIYTVLILFVPQAIMAIATQINPHLHVENAQRFRNT